MKLKLYQYAENCNPIYWECIKQLQSKLPSWVEYELHEKCPFPEYEHIKSLRLRSDLMRTRWLSQDGNNAYIDADTMCQSFPDISKWDSSKPWFTKLDGCSTGAVIFSMCNAGFFRDILRRYEALEYKGTLWLQRLLDREYLLRWNTIPSGHFQELSLCIMNDTMQSVGCRNFAIEYTNKIPKLVYVEGIIKNGNYI